MRTNKVKNLLEVDHLDPKNIPETDIMHDMVQHGHGLIISYDAEVNQLSKNHALGFRFGFTFLTIDGNRIDGEEVNVRLPENTPFSPTAALITKATPTQIYKQGDHYDIGAGKVKHAFKGAYKQLWDLCKDYAVTLTHANGKEENIRIWPKPIHKKDGTRYYMRLHNEGKQISYPIDKNILEPKTTYHDPDGQYWKKINFEPLPMGWNNAESDDPWITGFLHYAGIQNKFIHRKNRVDVFNIAKMVMAYGEVREDSLKIGHKINEETGDKAVSMKLTNMMQANTYDANPARNLRGGVTMSDGTKYDRGKAHVSPLYDSEAAAMMFFFMLSREPGIVRHGIKMARYDYAKNFLIRGLGTEQQPLLSFTRYRSTHNEPLHFTGMLITIDEMQGGSKKAVLLRLDTNFLKTSENDKSILFWDIEDWVNKIKEQKHDPESIVQVENLRKSPVIIDATTAFQKGRHKGHRYDDLHTMKTEILRHNIPQKIIAAYETIQQAYYNRDPADHYSLPRMQDYVYANVGDPNYLFIADKNSGYFHIRRRREIKGQSGRKEAYYYNRKGELIDFENPLYTRLFDKMSYDRKQSEYYMRIIEPHPVMWTSEENDPDFEAIRDHYLKKIKQRNKALRKKGLPTVPVLDTRPHLDENGNPARYRIKDERSKLWDMLKERGMATEEMRHTGNPYVDYMLDVMALYKLYPEIYTIPDVDKVARLWRIVDIPRHNGQETQKKMVEIPFSDYLAYSHADRMKLWEEKRLDITFDPIPPRPNHHAITERLHAHGYLKFFPADKKQKLMDYLRAEGCRSIHGDPDQPYGTELHFMTDAYALEEIKRLKKNVKVDTKYKTIALPNRDGQIGIYDYFGTDAEALTMISTWEDFFTQRTKNNPYTKKYKEISGFDPRDGEPVLRAEKEIMKKNVRVITVPEKHLQNPESNINIAEKFYYIQKPERHKLKRWQENGYDIVLKGSESGKHYLAPNATFIDHNAMRYKQQNYPYGSHQARAKDLYEQTGHPFPENDKLAILACSDIVPLSNVMAIDETFPSMKIPSSIYQALTAPVLIGNKEKAIAIMLPDYGYNLKKGALRLREIFEDDFLPEGTETGFEVTANVKKIQYYSLADLIKHEENDSLSHEWAQRMGHDDVRGVVDHYRRYFEQFDRPLMSPDNMLVRFEMDPIDTQNKPQSYHRINDRIAVVSGTPLYILS